MTRLLATCTAVCTAAALATALAVTPASAGDVLDMDLVDKAMVDRPTALAGGVLPTASERFTRTTVLGSEVPQRLWLCDITGTDEVGAPGSPVEYEKGFGSTVGVGQGAEVDQSMLVYATAAEAGRVFRMVKSAIKRCSGTHVVDPEQGLGSITVTLRNGRGVASDGDGFLWVQSRTVIASANFSYEEYEYLTVRRAGSRGISVMEVDREGAGVPKITKAQRTAIDRATDTLADRWAVTFG